MPIHIGPKVAHDETQARRRPMTPFLGTHKNRLDPKGRVSIPAAFRAVLRQQEGGAALILRPSHSHPCVEAWPPATFAALEAKLANHPLFSDNHDAMAAALFGRAAPAEADKDGRVMLPPDFITHAELGETVAFIGMGRTFQIWEPAAGEAFLEAARGRASSLGLTLPGVAA